jgi:hypothetical protein
MFEGWKLGDDIAAISALIALGAMGVTLWQAHYARQSAAEAKRQADAALGEVDPIIFLDARTFESPQATGGRALLTLVNHNRRDIRLAGIEIETDRAILVTIDTGDLRDVIAAAYRRDRSGDGPLRIDLRDRHHVIQGSSLGVAGSRESILLTLTRVGDRPYLRDTAEIRIAVTYILLDARHREKRVEVSATIPFRC